MANISAFVKGAAMRREFWTLGQPVPEGPFQILHLPHGSHELATLSLFARKQHTWTPHIRISDLSVNCKLLP